MIRCNRHNSIKHLLLKLFIYFFLQSLEHGTVSTLSCASWMCVKYQKRLKSVIIMPNVVLISILTFNITFLLLPGIPLKNAFILWLLLFYAKTEIFYDHILL